MVKYQSGTVTIKTENFKHHFFSFDVKDALLVYLKDKPNFKCHSFSHKQDSKPTTLLGKQSLDHAFVY